MKKRRTNASAPRQKRPEKTAREQAWQRFLRQNTWLVLLLVLILVAVVLFICVITGAPDEPVSDTAQTGSRYRAAYICAETPTVPCYDAGFAENGAVARGSAVTYLAEKSLKKNGTTYYLTYFDDLQYGYVDSNCFTDDPNAVVLEKTIYVRTPQNLRLSADGFELGGLVEQGTELQVLGFDRLYDVCGQTYPRKLDSRILNVLSSIAQSCYRFANDVRLLQHDRQLEEPFESTQVGSSAMAYKRNPMRCERICSLSRYVMADALNAPMTASTQWFERTLDDSANRRISLPEGFLAVDGILRLMQNVTAGLRVNEKIVAKFVADYLPFIATENLLMAAVERGGDRQQVHEIIRRASMRATEAMKNGEPWDLIAELAAEPTFGLTEAEIRAEMKPESYIGRCPEQVAAFTAKCRGLCTDAAKARADITL